MAELQLAWHREVVQVSQTAHHPLVLPPILMELCKQSRYVLSRVVRILLYHLVVEEACYLRNNLSGFESSWKGPWKSVSFQRSFHLVLLCFSIAAVVYTISFDGGPIAR